MSSDDIKVPLIDVRPDHWAIVQGTLQKHVPQCEVWAFGSRAKWTAKPYSDLDLAVICDQPLSFAVSAALADDFSESDLPWKVDVVDWATTSGPFRAIIQRDKVVVQARAAEWPTKPLSEFVSLQRGHDLTDSERRHGSVPVVGSAGKNGYHDTALVEGPGIVIGRSGSSFGTVHYCEERYWPHNTGLYVTNFKGNDPKFAFYVFQTIDFKRYNSGSAQPSLNRNLIAQIPIPAPEKDVQLAIAKILGAIDDKIELNRRTNKTLEAMAQALFKDWFIDFGPVRAKLEGLPPYLAPEIWSLFPDEGDKDGSPKGWHLCTLKDLTTKIGSGSTPRGGKEVYVDEGIALIRSQNVYDSEFVWSGLARITDQAAKQLSNVEVMRNDVLLNITGASILRTCVVEPGTLPARVNQHVAIIRAKDGIPCRFLHLYLLQKAAKDYLMGLNAGASREAVTKTHIESVPILNPGAALLGAFETAVAPIYAEVEALVEESRSLAQLRDLLLPKLISGELRISNPREFLEEATA
jgi:type I restriction enzyme S subunit